MLCHYIAYIVLNGILEGMNGNFGGCQLHLAIRIIQIFPPIRATHTLAFEIDSSSECLKGMFPPYLFSCVPY